MIPQNPIKIVEVDFNKEDLEAVLTGTGEGWNLVSVHIAPHMLDQWEEMFPEETIHYQTDHPMRGDTLYTFREVRLQPRLWSFEGTDAVMELRFRREDSPGSCMLVKVILNAGAIL